MTRELTRADTGKFSTGGSLISVSMMTGIGWVRKEKDRQKVQGQIYMQQPKVTMVTRAWTFPWHSKLRHAFTKVIMLRVM